MRNQIALVIGAARGYEEVYPSIGSAIALKPAFIDARVVVVYRLEDC